jgi:outer membrane protein
MKFNTKTIVGAVAFKIVLTGVILLAGFNSADAQSAKLAHVNTAELMQQIIVKDSIEFKLEQLQKEMQMDIQKKQLDFKKNYDEYILQKDSLSKILVRMTEERLREQQQQLEVLPQQYDQAFQAQQAEYMQPIRTKLELAIQAISATEGFTYVFDSSTLLYKKGGVDITEKIRTKLGLPKPAGTTLK